MRVIALCAASWRPAVRQAAGVEPLTCPPLDRDSFAPALLDGCDFLYVRLHGLREQPFWYGDSWRTAVSAAQLRQCDLAGAVVFAANCFVPESPMLPALFDAGARVVVAGEGVNYAGSRLLRGADVLGYFFRRLCGVTAPQGAFDAALRLARLALGRREAVAADTLAFRLYDKVTV